MDKLNTPEFAATDVTGFIRGDDANNQALWDHHNKVRSYHEPKNNKAEYLIDFAQGKQYTPEELQLFKEKKKTPVVINRLKPSERRILGHFSSSMFDANWQPVGNEDAQKAEIYQKLYMWESAQQKTKYKDPDILRQAWITGNAFQETWVEQQPGCLATIRTSNRNRYQVYFDPNSREPVTRDDAQFYDVLDYYSLEDLLDAFPEKAQELIESLSSRSRQRQDYTADDPANDRSIQEMSEKNGRFRVLERYLRVKKTRWIAWGREGKMDEWDSDNMEGHFEKVQMYGPGNIQVQSNEILWLIVSLDDSLSTNYLYNGPYHTQPINPTTGKIMWPMLELACETLAGETTGYVEHEEGPSKILNGMMSNVYDSARNASGAGKLYVPEAFQSQKIADQFAKYGADSNRSFAVKKEFINNAVTDIPKGVVNQDNYRAIELASQFFEEISSTPPSTQGVTEGGSGVKLQAQIEQALSQMLPFVDNYRLFCERRASLWAAYWRETYTDERTLRITNESTGRKEEVVINQMAVDPNGQIVKMNDLSSDYYDVVLVEGQRSPTYRMKTQQILVSMSQTPLAQQDPGLGAAIALEFANVSDLSADVKEMIMARCKAIYEQAQQAPQQQSAEQQMQQMQMQLEEMRKQFDEQMKMMQLASETDIKAKQAAADKKIAQSQSQVNALEKEALELQKSNGIEKEISDLESQLVLPNQKEFNF